jgi:pantoate--beta-alanine ligase
MQTLTTLNALQQWRQAQTADVVLVPTMGALHAGHLALIRHAKTLSPIVVVSIFVNPTQFGPTEDLARYPVTLEQDLQACEALGVSAVFTPSAQAVFPHGLATAVVPPAWLTNVYCGASRPGHFTGVATVVLKLFTMVQPHHAVFGQKDAQQLCVIQHMVTDLNLPVSIHAAPTHREADGLAMSSRNRYLTTPASRQAALHLATTLQHVANTVAQQAGNTLPLSYLDHAQKTPPALIQWDYLTAVNATTFAPATCLQAGVRLLGAIYVKQPESGIAVRLIDNWLIDS